MTDQGPLAQIRIVLQIGNFKVEVEGHTQKELTEKLSFALKAIQENTELSNSVGGALGVMPNPAKSASQSTVTADTGPDSSDALNRAAKDVGVSFQILQQLAEMKQASDYAKMIPVLKNRPDPEQAVYVICYLMQVGGQWDNIALKDLKSIVVKENGFPLPGNTFGKIVERMQNRQHAIRSPIQKRNKPIRLSLPGVEEARSYLRTWSRGLA